ncbi:MAG: hypothetical protein R3D46_10110 [Defluviimonas denitrificans]
MPLCRDFQSREKPALGAAAKPARWSLVESFAPSLTITAPSGYGTDAAARLADIAAAIRDTPAIPVMVAPQMLPQGVAATPSLLTFINVVSGKELLVPLNAKNTMLLPLFRAPSGVLAGESQRRRISMVCTVSTQADPTLAPGAGCSRAFAHLKSCLAGEGELQLDVIGFASETWHEAPRQDSEALNYSLAEGRRAAVLNLLARTLGGGSLSGAGLSADLRRRRLLTAG